MEGAPIKEPIKEAQDAVIEAMEIELRGADNTLKEIDETTHLQNDSVGIIAMEKMTQHIRLLTEELVKLKEILKPSETEN